MSAGEAEESQLDEGGAGGPGAPTPLSALEVAALSSPNYMLTLIVVIGSCRPHGQGYQTRR